MILKDTPEDFVVNELIDVETKDNGKYIYFWLKKTNYTLIRALQIIAKELNLKLKNFGFAGTKDKKAITKQMISVFGTSKAKLEYLRIKDIEIDFYGYGVNPISLGDLSSNEFIITVKDYDVEPHIEKNKFINYFGEQRFSKNNAQVGLFIIKQDFNSAIELLMQGDGDYENEIRHYLIDNSNNYVTALKMVPFKILKMFVHAYQSKIWNETAKYCVENKIDETSIPIVGFGTEFDNEEVEDFVYDILNNDEVSLRNFIIRQIPDISSEGTVRDLYIESNLQIISKSNKEIKLKFTLPKGAYATEVIRQLFN